WEETHARWKATRAAEAAVHPLPTGPGTIDVLSHAQWMLLSHDDVAWSPRPVFQPYQATSPSLQELNAEALRTRGADTLIADFTPVDGRWPTLDLGRSIPELLRWYDVRELPGEFLVLKRRATPRAVALTPAKTVRVPLGTTVRVPSAGKGPVWVTIEI